jgi:hypothetical protein
MCGCGSWDGANEQVVARRAFVRCQLLLQMVATGSLKNGSFGTDNDNESIKSNSSDDFGKNMFDVVDPFDAGDPDATGKPARYASLQDFHFLPTELKIITDGGPGEHKASQSVK